VRRCFAHYWRISAANLGCARWSRAPTPEEEDRRRLCRERKVLTNERVPARQPDQRAALRARRIRLRAAAPQSTAKQLNECEDGAMAVPCQSIFKTQISRELDRLELLLEQIKAVETERDALLAAQKVALARSRRPCLLDFNGIGPEFTAVLWSEGLFRHFDNRRQSCFLCRAGADALAKWIRRSRAGSSKAGNPDCGQHSFNSPGYGCAISRNPRWLCGLKHAYPVDTYTHRASVFFHKQG